MKDYMSNKYNGTCHACGKTVPSGTGKVEKSGYGRHTKWLVWCLDCFNASDNSGEEDRCCGNRAYEDRCAAACGCDDYVIYGGDMIDL